VGRRWNGWGDDGQHHALSASTLEFLRARLGPATPPVDASRADALGTIRPSRLPRGTSFDTEPAIRLDHAFGQSLPNWIAMRAGRAASCADGVAAPTTDAGVVAALAEARRLGVSVIGYGGGTSVVGHLNVLPGDRPVVNISLERLTGLQALDRESLLATFGAGSAGPAIEAALRAEGLTLGHYPQSFEYSTLGGWVATRSSGQQSLRYGRIEALFHGGRLVTPRGLLAVGGHAASSAGPDLREAVLGSEGRLGLLTEVTARVRPLPAHERFHALFFPDWAHGLGAVRELAQAGVALSMLRYSNERETETQLAMVDGHQGALRWLGRWLRLRGVDAGRCLLLAGITGTATEARAAQRALAEAAARARGVPVGTTIGRAWAKNRFRGPYLRNTLWDAGYAVETVETCVAWPCATAAMQAIEQAGHATLEADRERVLALTHLSHVYRQGCSIYSTFVFRSAGDPDANLERWRRLKDAASAAVQSCGGTISHQHGVGTDHLTCLPAEKGALGMDLVRALAHELDPDAMMNPGKLFA
jgi:alkyldihydroxyacetonephosphate synthase